MLDTAFCMAFFSLPVVMVYMLRGAGERLNRVTIVSFTTICLYLFSVVGTMPLFYMWDPYRVETGVINQVRVLEVLLCSCVNIVFFMGGVLFVRNIVKMHPLAIMGPMIVPISRNERLCLIVALIINGLVLWSYLQQVSAIALFVALAGNLEEAGYGRSEMGNNFGGNYHWYALAMRDIGNMITFTFFAAYMISKKRFDLILFLVSLAYSIFVAVMAVEKGPFAWLLIGLFVTRALVKSGGVVSLGKAIGLGAVLVCMLMFLYVLFMSGDGVSAALYSVFSRAFSGSITPAYFYLEYFPSHQEFLLGRTFPNPGGFFPFTPYLYTREVMDWVFPEHVASGVVGTMPTVFWGESYANFGYFGIPVFAFIVGAILAVISSIVSKIEITPLRIALTVSLALNFKNLAVTGFSGLFIDLYSFGIISFFVLVAFSKGKIRILRNRMAV